MFQVLQNTIKRTIIGNKLTTIYERHFSDRDFFGGSSKFCILSSKIKTQM
jgi:hypothetical protein